MRNNKTIMEQIIINEEYYYKIIRKNVRTFRLKKNLTQQELADLTGLSRGYICDIENDNRNKHLTIAALTTISAALEIDITTFFI